MSVIIFFKFELFSSRSPHQVADSLLNNLLGVTETITNNGEQVGKVASTINNVVWCGAVSFLVDNIDMDFEEAMEENFMYYKSCNDKDRSGCVGETFPETVVSTAEAEENQASDEDVFAT